MTDLHSNHPARRVLVTGGAGLLGSRLIRRAPGWARLDATRYRNAVDGCPSHAVDLADEGATDALVRELRPELIIHTAYGSADPDRDVWTATRNLAAAARGTGAALIHLSTDMVFDGERAPYHETSATGPINEYGACKVRAEEYVLGHLPGAAVIRTSLIVSDTPWDRASAWVVEALEGGEPATLFSDELRTPIAADDLADLIWEISVVPASARPGIWHLAGPEALSRYAIGLAIAARLGRPATALRPGSVRDAPVRRPRDLRLSTARADRALRTTPRPISHVLARPGVAPAGGPV